MELQAGQALLCAQQEYGTEPPIWYKHHLMCFSYHVSQEFANLKQPSRLFLFVISAATPFLFQLKPDFKFWNHYSASIIVASRDSTAHTHLACWLLQQRDAAMSLALPSLWDCRYLCVRRKDTPVGRAPGLSVSLTMPLSFIFGSRPFIQLLPLFLRFHFHLLIHTEVYRWKCCYSSKEDKKNPVADSLSGHSLWGTGFWLSTSGWVKKM